MKRSELEALKERTKQNIRKSLKTQTEKDVRKSEGDTHVEVKPEYVSISKYMRGAIFGIWTEADAEKRLYKALGQDSGTRGGFFVPPVLSNDVIELLKEAAVIRQMGVRILSVTGTDKVKFNSVTAAPSISWGSEAGTITEDTTMTFGQNTLETHKMVCLYKISRELLTNANVNMDALVRQELADALALEEDNAFLQGTGGTQPVGFYNNPRVNNTDLSGNITVDDLKDAAYQVRNTSYGEITGWVAHPRTVNYLSQLKDANGRYIFGTGPGERSGTLTDLLGLPLKQTTKISTTNRPGSTETFLVGGNWKDMLIGDGEGMRIETSTDAYFTTDEVGMKLVRFVGSMLRHPESFVVIKGITT